MTILTDSAPKNTSHNMPKTNDPTSGRTDNCGSHHGTRSYMDSLTNVTRPSPNVMNYESSFENDDDDDVNVDLMTTSITGAPNYRSPVRTRTTGECAKRVRGRRLLPAASSIVEGEGMLRDESQGSRVRHNPIVCAGQWTPEYQELDRTHGCGTPVRPVHGRQSSSIPRDFHRTSSYPARSSVHRTDPRYLLTRASAPGVLGSPLSRLPRGRSLDPPRGSQHPHDSALLRSTVAPAHPTTWISAADVMEEEDPSTETAALLNLTEELMGLRQGLKQARRANAGRLEMALRQISLLELELQRQRCLTHDAQVARDRQAERTRWERRLAATLSELKHCQLSIGQLRTQMDQLASAGDHSSASQAQIDRQRTELEATKAALDSQKEEISRLNNLLTQLLGADPADASAGDLAQLQAGLVELNRKMQSGAARSMNFSDPIRRTQSMHTGLASDSIRNPGVFASNQMLMGPRTLSGNLYCNVPEHHFLEDCMDQLQTRLQEAQLLQTEQQKKIRQATKAKRKAEKQIEEQNANVEMLTNDLNARQEELNQLREKFQRLSDEAESAQKFDQTRLGNLANEMVTIEQAIRERRAELTSLENRLHETNSNLATVQTQIQQASTRLTETRVQQTSLEGELHSVQLELRSSRSELVELQGHLDQARAQAQKFESTNRELESNVKQLEFTIQSKKDEFKQMSSSVDEVDAKLKRMHAELEAGETRSRTQQKLMAEDEAALNDRRAELRRLSSKILEDEARLESLAREIGEQRTELELIQAKQQRDLLAATQETRELTNKNALKQRELAETQSSLNALMDERAQITAFVESLRADQNKLQMDVQEKQKTLSDLSGTILRQRRELEHMTDMARLEETRLNELTSQQRTVLDELHKLQAQVRAESNELRGRDVAQMKKTSELQVTRTEVERETTELQRLTTERRTAETELMQLQQQLDLTRTQLNNMQQKVKDLERHESELLKSISTSKRQLSKISAEREAEYVSLRGLRNERAACQSEFDHLSECLAASRSEYERAQQRLSSAQSAADSQESELAEKERQRTRMNDELAKLGDAIHLGRLAKQNADEERESSESALQVMRDKLDQTREEKRKLDESITKRPGQKLASSRRDMDNLDTELMKKNAQLKSLKEKLKSMESRLAEMGATELKCVDLERRLQEKDRELQHLQLNQHHTQTKLSSLGPGASGSDSELVRALEETKAALAASRRDSKRLKRRTTRELSELERIAEEQSQRAGELTEQLALVRRQYAQLKGQISTYGILMDEVITVASQTELSEHGRRLEAALAAIRAELEQNLRDGEDPLLFQLDPTTLHNSEPGRARSGMELDTQGTSDLHRSLLVLTNSFHDLCHSSAHHSKSLFTSIDGTRPTNPGLYRPVAHTTMTPEGPPVAPLGTVNEMGENMTGTCRTGNTTITSGLGSSLNPTVANTDVVRPSGLELSGGSSVQHELIARKNGLKDKMIDRVSKQREQNAAKWEQSSSQFRAIRDQVDRVRNQLDGAMNEPHRTACHSCSSPHRE